MKEKLANLGFQLNNQFFGNIEEFILLLQKWGKIHNLTASLERSEIENNIIDSIYPLSFIDIPNTLADIGTGAGYPGMILAIASPTTKVTLIEPRAKRVAFLNFVKSALKLNNVDIIQNRVENIKHKDFDLITSRAVTNTSLLIEITKNISKKDTRYLFYKGSLCNEEIKDAKLNNYKVVSVGSTRNYLYIKKENKC
jgi:16S rRNA (guanine527-N7)-methyltransferase